MRLPWKVLRLMHNAKLLRRHWKGGWFHRVFGDRILDSELWRPTSASVSRAWLLGWLITTVPFLPGQAPLAFILCLVFRANLPLAIALQFVSTPLTAPIHLSTGFLLGKLVLGYSFKDTWEQIFSGSLTNITTMENGVALVVGCLVLGLLIGLIGYLLIPYIFKKVDKVVHSKKVLTLGAKLVEPIKPCVAKIVPNKTNT